MVDKKMVNWLQANQFTAKQLAVLSTLARIGPNGTLEGFLMDRSERAVASSLVRRGYVEKGTCDNGRRTSRLRVYRITRKGMDYAEEYGIVGQEEKRNG